MNSNKIKTSQTHPLRIDWVQPLGVPGRIGMTFCPGKKQHDAMSGGDWDRDLALDIKAILEWDGTVLVSLLEDHEIEELQVGAIEDQLQGRLDFYRIPIADGDVPDARAEAAWQSIGTLLRRRLVDGESIVIHCKGGLGRTGTMAARVLVEFGEAPEEAMRRVRTARAGAIENAKQEAYVLACTRAQTGSWASK